jgi:ketosteroid isomerase-like protein
VRIAARRSSRWRSAAARPEERLLRRAYESFNNRDIEGALALMQPDVDWPNGMEGGRERGRAAVRAYWTRQFELIDSKVEPIGFEVDDDGRIVVGVHQVVRDLEGALLSDTRVRHVYTFRDGLVERMDIHEP